MSNKREKLRDQIISERSKGNVVILNEEGLFIMKLSDIIKQPAEGILYDINRCESVVFTFLDDPKWINDFAASQIIIELKKEIERLENKLKEKQNS